MLDTVKPVKLLHDRSTRPGKVDSGLFPTFTETQLPQLSLFYSECATPYTYLHVILEFSIPLVIVSWSRWVASVLSLRLLPLSSSGFARKNIYGQLQAGSLQHIKSIINFK